MKHNPNITQQQAQAQHKARVEATRKEYAALIQEIEAMAKRGETVGYTWNKKTDRAAELQDKMRAQR